MTGEGKNLRSITLRAVYVQHVRRERGRLVPLANCSQECSVRGAGTGRGHVVPVACASAAHREAVKGHTLRKPQAHDASAPEASRWRTCRSEHHLKHCLRTRCPAEIDQYICEATHTATPARLQSAMAAREPRCSCGGGGRGHCFKGGNEWVELRHGAWHHRH